MILQRKSHKFCYSQSDMNLSAILASLFLVGAGIARRKQFSELWGLAQGKIAERTNQDKIILFDSLGLH